MKQLKRLLRKKGFTISEVLVAMMIFAIMTAIVMQILAIAINQHKNNVNSERIWISRFRILLSITAIWSNVKRQIWRSTS